MIRSQEVQATVDEWRGILTTGKFNQEKEVKDPIKVDQGGVSRDFKKQDITDDNEKENVNFNEHPKTGVNSPEKLNVNKSNEVNDFINKGDNASNGDFLTSSFSLQNGNSKFASYQKQLGKVQKGLNKNILPVDIRECEKERLAKLCENSQSSFGKHETDKRYLLLHSNNTKNSKDDKSKFVSCISEREKEVKRLAELFENSTSSHDRVESQLKFRPHSSVSSNNICIDDEGGQNISYIKSNNHEVCTNILNGDIVNGTALSSLVQMSAPVKSSIWSSSTGFGEYGDKRKQLIEQRKKDYCDYMHQARLKMRKTRPEIEQSQPGNVSTRHVAVQTDFSYIECAFERPSHLLDNNDCLVSSNVNKENKPRNGSSTSVLMSRTQLEESPSQSSEDALSVHTRQFIYGEQLKKQIEEKQKLEAERKEKENLQEEAMERRYREQQERLRKQYEMEELQRLEYKKSRHAHNDRLYQTLTEAEIKGIQSNCMNYRKQHQPIALPCSNNTPFLSSADFPSSLLRKRNILQHKNTSHSSIMTSTISNTAATAMAKNDTSKTADEGVTVLSKEPSKPVNLNGSNSHSNDSNNDNVVQIDPLVGVDLLADNINVNNGHHNDNIIDDMIVNKHDNGEFGSLNMISRTDNMINDQNRSIISSTSPAVPAVRSKLRLASKLQLLEDKWKVPAVEKTYIKPTVLYHHQQPVKLLPSDLSNDITSNNGNRSNGCNEFHSHGSNNVVTQLGSFRQQLLWDHLKLQEKFRKQQMSNSSN